MLPLEDGEVLGAVVLLEVGLAVYVFVLVAKESPYESFLFFIDVFEGVFLHLFVFGHHLLVDHKVLGTILPLVAEGLALAQTAKGEQTCHAEGWVDKDAWIAFDLLDEHGPHGGSENEVGMEFVNLFFYEINSLKRRRWNVGRDDGDASLVEHVAQVSGCAAASGRSKAVNV